MKVNSAVLLALFAAVTHQTMATGATAPLPVSVPVNDFNAPVLEHGVKINYQQHDILAQKAAMSDTNEQQQATTTSVKKQAEPLLANNQNSGATLNPVLEIFGLGSGIGVQGLLSGDYNNDGINELVLGNPYSIVFAQTINGQFTPQQQLAFSAGIGKLVYFRDLSSDGHFAFFGENAKLHKLDLITRRVVASLDIDYSSYQLQTGKAAALFVRTYTGQLHMVDPVTLKIVSSQSDVAADIAATGTFTAKNQPQILLRNGQIYNVLNNKLSLEKTITANLSAFINAVDVNADGLDEILLTRDWYDMQLFSPNTEEVFWSKNAELDIDAVILADVDKDGKLDGVYGDGQWGNLYAFNLQTGENFWRIKNPDHGVTNIVVADLDNDGKQDIGWGAGYSSSGADYFYIHDINSKEKKWQSEDIQFPIGTVALVDVNQDGNLDALTASKEGDKGGVIQAFDIKTKTRLWHAIAAAMNWGKTMHMATADLDKDGVLEIVIGSSQTYTGMVRVLNTADGSERYKILLDNGDAISSVLTADLDQDGFEEIIVSNKMGHTGSYGSFITVLNGRTGALIKPSTRVATSWQGATDLTAVEIAGNWFVYGLQDGQLFQYNFSNNSIKQLATAAYYYHLTSLVTEGVTELAVTDSAGNLLRLSTDGVVLATKAVCKNAVSGLSGSGPDRVLFTCNNNLSEYNLASQTTSFNHEIGFNTAGDPKLARHENLTQVIVGGQKIEVYQSEAPVVLPAPQPVRLNTHVLKTLTGNLSIAAEIDYFVLASSAKAGQFSFVDRKTGQFTYKPNGNTGTETLKFYAVKGNAVSPTADISIELTNNKPIADNLNIQTHWNKGLQFTLPAKDDDQEALTFALSSEPKHGKLKLTDPAMGSTIYVPSGNSLETVSFAFNAKDSLVSSEQKNVVITLTNTTPVASAVSYSTSYKTPVNGSLKGLDADNDLISYEITTQPTAGNLTLDSKTGLFVYTAAGDTDQQISFSYVVKDKFASSTAQTVSINVKGEPKKSSGGAFGLLPFLMLLLLTKSRRQKLN